MHVVIMGCGRVGASVATRLDRDGHDVTILDTNAYAFDRYLPDDYSGEHIEGSGVDDRILDRAGIGDADVFIALTGGDNRNLLASQKAKEIYGVRHAVSRVKDPLRAELFERLGLRTYSPTTFGAELALEAIFESAEGSSAGDNGSAAAADAEA